MSVLDNSYEYQIFLNIRKTDGDNNWPDLPELPGELRIRIHQEGDNARAWVYSVSFAIGHARAELEEFVKWIAKTLEEMYPQRISLHDPQMGRPVTFPRDSVEWVDNVCRHDSWILSNIGGDSLHVEEYRFELPPRTKMILWFAVMLLALYLLTHFGLSLYFR